MQPITVCLLDSHHLRSAFPCRLTQCFCAAGCSAFARHYSRNRLSSSDYLDVSVRPVPSRSTMCSSSRATPCRVAGFPIRISPVHSAAHASPELFAVYRVLHRHSSPSHSPCALVAFPLEPRLAENFLSTNLSVGLNYVFFSRYRDILEFPLPDGITALDRGPSSLSALRLRCAVGKVAEFSLVRCSTNKRPDFRQAAYVTPRSFCFPVATSRLLVRS